MTKLNLKSAFVLGAAFVGLSAGAAFAAVTTSDQVNLMAGPNQNSKIIATLAANTTVSVGQMSGDWCRITAPARGWVACANLDGLSRTNLGVKTGFTGYEYDTDPYLGSSAPGGLHTPYNGEFH
ncbi:MAG TPA: SH3 domain-containing protein [Devosia sp.]|nr:SH3 domain-containing protein [Devosia sp.]